MIMPTILKREYAPISSDAWQEIDDQASESINNTLTCRKVVDFKGPYGWDFGAVNVGRLQVSSKGKSAINWGTRQVQPVIEIREPFKLKQMELDNISRGAGDADLDPVMNTAIKAAKFEDQVVYNGFKEADIEGVIPSSAHKAIALPAAAGSFPSAISKALRILFEAEIGGPYNLVLGPDPYFTLLGGENNGGFPPFQTVEQMLKGGEIIMSSALSGGVLMSGRGGDFELSVGKDYSVGYAGHDRDEVEFFITESFTFRVIEPKASVVLAANKK
jgi:uncharacterized linocin/CFP29 family protein